MVFKTILVEGVAWPAYTTPVKPPKKRPDRVSPRGVRIAQFIDDRPGHSLPEIGMALKLSYSTVYDHVYHGLKVGRYAREGKGIVCVKSK